MKWRCSRTCTKKRSTARKASRFLFAPGVPLVRADERLREEFPRITLPVLIMHGTDDRATVCRGSEFFYETAGSNDKTLKLYEGHYHDLLNDLGKEAVMADITRWIDAHLPT